jgi:hypothetical protein
MSKRKPPNKELCDWSKDELRKHFEQLCQIVAEPRFVCKKCGRAANRKKWLCDGEKLSPSSETAP